jgi:hypothetical protein
VKKKQINYLDFEFEPRLLTKEEKEKISAYIIAYKAKHSSDVGIQSVQTEKNVKKRKNIVA